MSAQKEDQVAVINCLKFDLNNVTTRVRSGVAFTFTIVAKVPSMIDDLISAFMNVWRYEYVSINDMMIHKYYDIFPSFFSKTTISKS